MSRLKALIVERLDLAITADEIGDDQPLFGSEEGSIGLDSVEALELAIVVEVEFAVPIDEETAVKHFYSVATLSAYISELLDAQPATG